MNINIFSKNINQLPSTLRDLNLDLKNQTNQLMENPSYNSNSQGFCRINTPRFAVGEKKPITCLNNVLAEGYQKSAEIWGKNEKDNSNFDNSLRIDNFKPSSNSVVSKSSISPISYKAYLQK